MQFYSIYASVKWRVSVLKVPCAVTVNLQIVLFLWCSSLFITLCSLFPVPLKQPHSHWAICWRFCFHAALIVTLAERQSDLVQLTNAVWILNANCVWMQQRHGRSYYICSDCSSASQRSICYITLSQLDVHVAFACYESFRYFVLNYYDYCTIYIRSQIIPIFPHVVSVFCLCW